MKKTPFLLALLGFSALVSQSVADDLTIGNQTYKGYEITEIRPNEISIMHSEGIARINTADLPKALQEKIEYDPQAAAVADQDDRDARAQRDAAIKQRDEAIRQRAEVAAKAEEADANARAQAAADAKIQRERQAEADELAAKIEAKKGLVVGRIVDRCDQGLIVACEEPREYAPGPPVGDRMSRTGMFVGGSPRERKPSPISELDRLTRPQGYVLLVDYPDEKNLAAEDRVRAIALRDGVSDSRTKNGLSQHTSIPIFRFIKRP